MLHRKTEPKLSEFSFSGRIPEELVFDYHTSIKNYKDLYTAVTDGFIAKLTKNEGNIGKKRSSRVEPGIYTQVEKEDIAASSVLTRVRHRGIRARFREYLC